MTYQNALKFASHLSPAITQGSFPCIKRTKKLKLLMQTGQPILFVAKTKRNKSPQLFVLQ